MKLILFFSLLLAVASGAPVEPVETWTQPITTTFATPVEPNNEAHPAYTAFRKAVGDETVPDEAIKTFFDLNITLPFTPETLAAYKEWSEKWGIDIPDLEAQSNDEMMLKVQKEVSRRLAEIFYRIGARAVLHDQFSQTGQLSQESTAMLAEINEKSTIFESELVDTLTEQMAAAVMKEWGVVAVDGQPETVESEDEQGPLEQQNPEVEGEDNESDANTEGDDDEEEATTNEPEQKPEEQENEQNPEEENNEADEATTASVVDEDGEATTNEVVAVEVTTGSVVNEAEEAATNEPEQKPEEVEEEPKPEDDIETVAVDASTESVPEVVTEENTKEPEQKPEEQENEPKPATAAVTVEAITELAPAVVTEVTPQAIHEDDVAKVEETTAVDEGDEKKGDDEPVDNKTY